MKSFINFLPPWVETNIQPAFYDKESGSVLQQTARMYAKVNQLVRHFNELSKEVQSYIQKFVELKDFVDTYFENLDVQEEINNKLDEMAEDGTLQALFAGYGLEIGEDSKVKVKAGTGITVDENGVSITPYKNYIEGVTNETYDYTNELTGTETTIYYSIIPAGNKPKIVLAGGDDPNVAKRPSEFDFKHKPTSMINAGAWDTNTHIAFGPIIIDGNIIQENNQTGGTDNTRPILGIKSDGEIVSINGSTPADEVDAESCVRVWYTVVNHNVDTTAGLSTELEPRSFIAQSMDGSYLIGSCGGRTYRDSGMSKQNIADFLFNKINFNPKVAFCLDGGGSSCMMYKGIRQNPLINNENRRCPNYIVFSSTTANEQDGVFEAQSVNNAKLIDQGQDKSTAWLSAQTLNAMLDESTAENCHISANSTGRVIEGVLVCLNLNFTLTENQTSYSYFLDNLPAYSGIGKNPSNRTHYFTATHMDNPDTSNRVCQFFLQMVEGKGCCLRNRFALPAGEYELNICYLTQP